MSRAIAAAPLLRLRRLLSATGRAGFGNVAFGFGLLVIIGAIGVAALAPVLAPQPPNFAAPLLRYLPVLSPGHIFGTDELGRDIASRLIYGTRLALVFAVGPTVLALLLGGISGLVAGYVGGVLDTVAMRLFDVLFAFPGILLALGISAALGPGLFSMIVAMIVVTIPAFGRLMRGEVVGLRQALYVEAAHNLGYSGVRVLFRHIAPNVAGTAIVFATLQTGRNVILAASLSFLGLGPQPPTADWGQMLSSGRTALATAPHVATIPGLAIVLLAVSFNLLGDGARDLLDPTGRHRTGETG
jgi:peptide/nickel transport system permease protein